MRPSAARIVGRTRAKAPDSTSSQVSGSETGAPGRGRSARGDRHRAAVADLVGVDQDAAPARSVPLGRDEVGMGALESLRDELHERARLRVGVAGCEGHREVHALRARGLDDRAQVEHRERIAHEQRHPSGLGERDAGRRVEVEEHEVGAM